MSTYSNGDCREFVNSTMGAQSWEQSRAAAGLDRATGSCPSAWSRSRAKRCFDVLAVTFCLPFVLPVLIAIAIAVRLSSSGPALFIQRRIGKDGAPFCIYKFRTMAHNSEFTRSAVTTIGNQHFTSIGPFLRKWKLDELPQLLNVLRGEMSLVGPRPKMPEHESGLLLCRPGITGAATLAVGREEVMLAGISINELAGFVRDVLLPWKKQIDGEYMARASFASDLKLIVKSAFRRWPDRCSELPRFEPQLVLPSGRSREQALPINTLFNRNEQRKERAAKWRSDMNAAEVRQDLLLKSIIVLAMVWSLAGCGF